MEEKICIIIPVKNSLSILDKTLHSIWDLNYPVLEIIVVDDGLNEVSLKVLERFKDKIKILKSNSRGPSYARNLAAKDTDAEFVAFTDDDCVVDRNWFKELLRGFKQYPKAVACGGVQKLPQDASDFEKKVFLFMKKTGFITDYMRRIKGERVAEVNHNASCNVMYKREIFLKEGGFLEGLWPGGRCGVRLSIKKKGI